MPKVLLLTAAFGDGHRQVSRALRQSFEQRKADVQELDCFQQTNRQLADLSQWVYEASTRYVPQVYGAVHRLTAKIPGDHPFWTLVSMSSKKALLNAVQRWQPEIVLQLFPDQAAQGLSSFAKPPFVGVVLTDFSVHSRWFHSNVDAYYVPHRRLMADIQPLVDPSAEMVDSGIPIRAMFREAGSGRLPDPATAQTAAASGAPGTTPYVLLATGGRGLFPQLSSVLDVLQRQLPHHHVYVMCGRNADMLRQVEAFAEHNPRVHGLGFVNHVVPWYRHAACAIVKSGGITLSECMACECPVVCYKPQPGQEGDNADFMAKMGAGVIVRQPADLARWLSLPHFAARLSSMRKACGQLARLHAADVIAEHALRSAQARRAPSGTRSH